MWRAVCVKMGAAHTQIERRISGLVYVLVIRSYNGDQFLYFCFLANSTALVISSRFEVAQKTKYSSIFLPDQPGAAANTQKCIPSFLF